MAAKKPKPDTASAKKATKTTDAPRKTKTKDVVKEVPSNSKSVKNSATPLVKAVKKDVVKQAPVETKPAKKVAEKAVKPAAKKTPVENKPTKVVVKTAPKVAVEVPAPAAKKVTPATRSRSSVVDFPAPPAPIKPPFVPPKPPVSLTPTTNAGGKEVAHSAAFIQRQRQRLLDLRDELVDAVSGIARDTIRNGPEGSEASGSGQHQGDAGSDAYDRDFALSVLAKEQDALYEIEQALRRIQSGTYGICEISSNIIPQPRLEAIPFARLTVACQAQWEKEYGNRRFRPSNEVGFSGGKYVDDDESETVSLDEDED